jgi:hypothetical protein
LSPERRLQAVLAHGLLPLPERYYRQSVEQLSADRFVFIGIIRIRTTIILLFIQIGNFSLVTV